VTALDQLRDRAPPVRVFVAATGAGAGVQQALWNVPGASAFLVGASFPYAASETARLLGFAPARHCSRETALELAMAAYLRARGSFAASEWGEGAGRAIGLGLTASVATLEPHRGEHRIFVATFAPGAAAVWSARIRKGAGARARERDGNLADELGVAALLSAAGVAMTVPDVGDGAVLERRGVSELELRQLLFERPLFAVDGARLPVAAGAVPASVMLPGSFAPFHAGHRAVADAVEAAARRPAIYAITADPVHKPALGAADLLDRVASIRREAAPRAVLLTERDPLFIDKARQFPGAGIAVGVDAVARMLDPAWGPDVVEMLRELRTLGTRFFVMGRSIAGRWTTLRDVPIPAGFDDLFTPLEGREDVSSTDLRAVTSP
jgi:hypothetical protein